MKRRIRKAAGSVILCCLVLIAVISLYNIIKIVAGYAEQRNVYEDTRKTARTEEGVDWEELASVNSDVIGWIRMPDTNIDYPVVQGDDNSRYLNVLFDGTQGSCGTLFADFRQENAFHETNTIIYGHNMKDGSMFGGLKKFKDREYFEEHRNFELLTPTGDYTLKAVAVLVIEPTDELYNPCVNDETSAGAWVSRVVSEANFCVEEELDADGHYVMLSTCSTPDRNLRDVVIARVEV
ncbi:MAG: class B sortase [Anaerovoracaceae bacterium]